MYWNSFNASIDILIYYKSASVHNHIGPKISSINLKSSKHKFSLIKLLLCTFTIWKLLLLEISIACKYCLKNKFYHTPRFYECNIHIFSSDRFQPRLVTVVTCITRHSAKACKQTQVNSLFVCSHCQMSQQTDWKEFIGVGPSF